MMPLANRALRRWLWFGTVVLLASAWGRAVQADVVDYSAQASGNVTSPFTLGGVTATSSGQLAIEAGAGLGVVGGTVLLGPGISGSESVEFAFDVGGATDVSFTSIGAFNIDQISAVLTIEGLGIGGASLGSVGFNLFSSFPTYNVSSLFGNVPLSGFSIIGNGTDAGLSGVATISFTPQLVAVPEPSVLALFGIGIAGLAIARRRKVK